YVLRIENSAHYPVTEFIEELSSLHIQQKKEGDVHSVNVEFEDGTTFFLKENLKTDMILSRAVNGREFNNAYLLQSNFAAYTSGEGLDMRELDPDGNLAAAEPKQASSSVQNITLNASDFFVYSPHVDDSELYRQNKFARTIPAISHHDESG